MMKKLATLHLNLNKWMHQFFSAVDSDSLLWVSRVLNFHNGFFLTKKFQKWTKVLNSHLQRDQWFKDFWEKWEIQSEIRYRWLLSPWAWKMTWSIKDYGSLSSMSFIKNCAAFLHLWEQESLLDRKLICLHCAKRWKTSFTTSLIRLWIYNIKNPFLVDLKMSSNSV